MKKLLISTLLSIAVISSFAQKYNLSSPDGILTAEISIGATASLDLSKGTQALLTLKDMDLVSADERLKGMRVVKTANQSVSETVIPAVKEKSTSYPENYNELTIEFKSDKALIFRLYNEGLAYRFRSSAKDSLIIYKENMSIQFHEGDSTRYQSSKSFNSAYETPYEHDAVSEMETPKLCYLPMLVEERNGSFVMVTESDLYNYPGLWLRNRGGAVLEALHPPYPKAFNYSGSVYGHGQVKETYDFIARVEGQRNYPWRIFADAEMKRS